MGKKRHRNANESKIKHSGSDGETDNEIPAPVRHSEEEPESKKVWVLGRINEYRKFILCERYI